MKPLNYVLLRQEIRVGPDLGAWLAQGGGEGLEQALADPAALIPLIEAADLRGLGGSGFPAHRKWRFMAESGPAAAKYLIVNGNEDEPGTFKDRLLLDETPHQVIEGALIAAAAVGATQVLFYINPAITQGLRHIRKAVKQWQESGLLERYGRPIELKVHPSSGHYIGGEETAAISSVEGGFPFPKVKPPYPAEKGVHGHPTLINNVETLSNVSHIVRRGAPWFRDLGLGAASGAKLYCLSGDVLRPGVYELPMGTPLAELVYQHGNGLLLDKKLKAVFTGGPSNTILTAKDLDVALDFESVLQRRARLGTGAMIVVSHGTGIVKRVTEYLNFFAASSCGQCPSCKTGTYYAALLLRKIDTGQGSRADLESLQNLCRILPGSGRCHLPDGAIAVLRSSLDQFMPEYEQAIGGRRP